MKNKILIPLLNIILLFSFWGCGASITPTSDRYKKGGNDIAEETKTKETKENKNPSEPAEDKPNEKKTDLPPKHPDLREDFDISPYKTKLDLKDPFAKEEKTETDMWVEFDRTESKSEMASSAKIIPGYRVQVSSTDNLDEANSLKSEVYFKIKLPVYVIFDSPFYKVRAGDFIDMKAARDLNFKLNQLGYKETRVVPDSVNIVK